jgi:F0F1-type ATP synthase membrane subunit b/b'
MKNLVTIIIVAILFAAIGAFTTYVVLRNKYKDTLETYERQLKGELTDAEQELQEANEQLQTLRAELIREKELADLAKADLADDYYKKVQNLRRKYNMELDSYSRTIARLEQEIEGMGETTVEVDSSDTTKTKIDICAEDMPPIKYTYTLPQGDIKRFHLTDPDICEKGDENLTINQTFSMQMVIQQQEDGFLKTQQVWLNEIDPITKEVIAEAELDLDACDFKYRAKPPELPVEPLDWRLMWFNFLNPNILVSYDTEKCPGVGLELLRIWRLGANVRYNHDVDDSDDSRLSSGLVYHIGWGAVETNVGVGGSVSTPISDMGGKWIGTVEVTFDMLK